MCDSSRLEPAVVVLDCVSWGSDCENRIETLTYTVSTQVLASSVGPMGRRPHGSYHLQS